MYSTPETTIFSLLPLLLMTLPLGIVSHLLAKDKGRNVSLWTILGLIPLVNYFCILYFMGASNLRLEKKVDYLLRQQDKAQ